MNARLSRAMGAALLALSATTLACSKSDASLQSEVQSQIAADAAMSGAQVQVSASDHVIYLSGELAARSQQARAVELARTVKGVKDVVPSLELSEEGHIKEIAAAIAADPVVGKIPLQVKWQGHGVTRLESDQTNADERKRINEIALQVPDVTQVVDMMR